MRMGARLLAFLMDWLVGFIWWVYLYGMDVTPSVVVAGSVVAVSLVTFVFWGVDKSKAARGAWRIPEKTLLLLALLGGWPGAWFGAKVFRHKSSKQSFRRKLMAVTVLNLVVFGWILWAIR
ncbi:MAG: uncharacterized membrane protein YsdA (DUF1294 family) [Planctomycetota bacterium]|jgi:uncharacterized membrane protein YsdA (DUF1294 family)